MCEFINYLSYKDINIYKVANMVANNNIIYDVYIDKLCKDFIQNFDTYGIKSVAYNTYKLNPTLFTHLWLLEGFISLFANNYSINDEMDFIKKELQPTIKALCYLFLYDDLIKSMNNHIHIAKY